MEEQFYCTSELHALIIFLTKSAIAQEDRNPFGKKIRLLSLIYSISCQKRIACAWEEDWKDVHQHMPSCPWPFRPGCTPFLLQRMAWSLVRKENRNSHVNGGKRLIECLLPLFFINLACIKVLLFPKLPFGKMQHTNRSSKSKAHQTPVLAFTPKAIGS